MTHRSVVAALGLLVLAGCGPSEPPSGAAQAAATIGQPLAVGAHLTLATSPTVVLSPHAEACDDPNSTEKVRAWLADVPDAANAMPKGLMDMMIRERCVGGDLFKDPAYVDYFEDVSYVFSEESGPGIPRSWKSGSGEVARIRFDVPYEAVVGRLPGRPSLPEYLYLFADVRDLVAAPGTAPTASDGEDQSPPSH